MLARCDPLLIRRDLLKRRDDVTKVEDAERLVSDGFPLVCESRLPFEAAGGKDDGVADFGIARDESIEGGPPASLESANSALARSLSP